MTAVCEIRLEQICLKLTAQSPNTLHADTLTAGVGPVVLRISRLLQLRVGTRVLQRVRRHHKPGSLPRPDVVGLPFGGGRPDLLPDIRQRLPESLLGRLGDATIAVPSRRRIRRLRRERRGTHVVDSFFIDRTYAIFVCLLLCKLINNNIPININFNPY